MSRLTIKRILLLSLVLLFPLSSYSSQDSGEAITKRGTVHDDYYVAGGTVDIDAEINGDVIAAGGELYIGRMVLGDILAAGGTIKIRGNISDDVRVSGGNLNIEAIIGDDLAASGGSISILPGTKIGGDGWIAGGEISMAGMVGKDLHMVGGDLRLSGAVSGNVILEGGEITVLDGAIIKGDLRTRSPNEVTISPAAKITGQVNHETIEWDYDHGGVGFFFPLTLIVAGISLIGLFPGFTLSSADRIKTDPWKCLGIGFGVFVLTPVVAIVLMAIVLGVWIGLSILAIYFLALLAGFLVATFFIGKQSAKLVRIEINTTARRMISIAIVIFLLSLILIIPVIGGLAVFVLLLLGIGAGSGQLYALYKTNGAAV